MTHLPGTPHVAKIAIGFQYALQQIENVFYVRDPSDAIFADPEGFLNSVKAAVVSDLVPHNFANLLFNQLGFEDVRSIPFGGLVIPISPVVPGPTAATASLPGSVCVAVKKNTGNIGRSGRGRWYWPLTDISTISAGDQVNATYANAVVAALFSFQGGVEGIASGLQMGINSYYLNKVVRTAGEFQPITSWSLTDYNVDSQRRRLTGRGR